MKFKFSRRTTTNDLIAMAKQELAQAKSPEDREKFQIALELAEAGVVPPWIKQSRRPAR